MWSRRFVFIGLILAGAAPVVHADEAPEQRLTAQSGAASDAFGRACAIDGDTLVIGADQASVGPGFAEVFVRDDGVWTRQQRLTATAGDTDDRYGWSVAISGDTIVVGAPRDDDEATNSGAGYVYTRTAGVWSLQQKLTDTSSFSEDWIGHGVAIDGDTIALGAPIASYGSTGIGAVFVFTRSGTTWTLQQKVFPSSIEANMALGNAVALQGDTLLVGAWEEDTDGSASGGGFVFVRSMGVWTEQGHLLAGTEGGAFDRLGHSVALDGDTAVLGSMGDNDDDGISDVGSAYVFTRSGTAWTKQQKIRTEDGVATDRAGSGLALRGDTLVVGVEGHDLPMSGAGGTYVFTRDTGVWTQTCKLIPDFTTFRPILMGTSVALDGGTVVSGGVGDALNVFANFAGSAYTFDLAPLGVANTFGPLTAGQSYVGQLDATGGVGPFAWALETGTIPFNGGVLVASGLLDGTVGDDGDYPFVVGVSDSVGRVGEAAFVVTVNPAPMIEGTTTLPPFVPGRSYAFDFDGTGGTPPLVWSTPDGVPAGGLAIDGTSGLFSGDVPGTATGSTDAFDVRLTDDNGVADSRGVVLPVATLFAFPPKKTKTAKVDLALQTLEGDSTARGIAALELVRGSLLSAVAKFPKADTPRIEWEITRQDATPVPAGDFTTSTKKSLKLRKLPIDTTNRYFVRISGVNQFDQPVSVFFQVTPPKKARDAVTIPADGAEVQVETSALPNARLTIQVKARKGEALLPTILSVKDGDDTELLDTASVKDGSRKAKAVVQVGANSELTITFAGLDANGGEADWSAKSKNPRGYGFDLADLPAGSTD